MLLFDSATWRDLATQPTVSVAVTVFAYRFAVRLHRRAGGHALFNPTLVAIAILAAYLKASGVAYVDYARGAAIVTFILSPAVVLLAVPLFRQRATIRASGRIIAGALTAGFLTGASSAVAIAWLLGADRQTLLSLAPKSTTAAIAIGISEKIGGVPGLTVVLVIMTGIMGAVSGPSIARVLRVSDPRAVGLAMGICSHGIGTARALQISEVAGAFSGLGMGLNGVLTAVLLPLLAIAL